MAMLLGPFGPGPTESTPSKSEGSTKEEERIAMFLACWSEITSPPNDRLEILAIWEAKRPTVRDGYRRAAKLLLQAWGR